MISFLPASGIYVGTAVTSQETFANPSADIPRDQWPPVDPTTITLKFQVGRQAPTIWVFGISGEIVRLSQGVYSAELDTTSQPGMWTVVWIGTGACAAADAGVFQVNSLPV